MKLFLIPLLFFSFKLAAQKTPLPANDVLTAAYQKATKENKKVFLLFTASWCGWCKKMDAALNEAALKRFFDEEYIVTNLVVYEYADKKHLENPGALELLKKYGGADQGIPYWMVFDEKGVWLADSQIRSEGADYKTVGQNTGCPTSPEEVAHFISVLEKTSDLSADELEVIKMRFLQNSN